MEFSTQDIDNVKQAIKWYEYPVATTKPTTAYTQLDIDNLQAQHDLVTSNGVLSASEKRTQWAAIGVQIDQINFEKMLQEKYEYAWHSLDSTTFLVSCVESMEGSLPAGFVKYNFQDGHDRLYRSGLYDPMTRGV